MDHLASSEDQYQAQEANTSDMGDKNESKLNPCRQ